MHLFWAFMIGSSLQAIVFRVMALLGIGVVTFSGSQIVLDGLVDRFVDHATQLGSDGFMVLGYMWVDRAFSQIIGAITVAITITASKSVIGRRNANQ